MFYLFVVFQANTFSCRLLTVQTRISVENVLYFTGCYRPSLPLMSLLVKRPSTANRHFRLYCMQHIQSSQTPVLCFYVNAADQEPFHFLWLVLHRIVINLTPLCYFGKIQLTLQ